MNGKALHDHDFNFQDHFGGLAQEWCSVCITGKVLVHSCDSKT